jgi:hypothetical protein
MGILTATAVHALRTRRQYRDGAGLFLQVQLDAFAARAQFATVQTINARSRSWSRGRRLAMDFALRAVRRAYAIIEQNGPENVGVIIQGKLLANDKLADAGLNAQVKAHRAEQQQQQAAARWTTTSCCVCSHAARTASIWQSCPTTSAFSCASAEGSPPDSAEDPAAAWTLLPLMA